MIQLKRGTTGKWRESSIKLKSGQPGYDKNKHKLKVGDGVTLWADLPYASGLSEKEILSSEVEAQATRDTEDKFAANIITYGTGTPDSDTVGQIYLQQIDEPEVDYVIESGTSGIWTYQKWKSGIAKCWCNFSIRTTVKELLELFYRSDTTGGIAYPFTFEYVPTETATVQSSGGQVLLANSSANTNATSGAYAIISLAGEISDADYRISIQVEGFWRAIDDNKN